MRRKQALQVGREALRRAGLVERRVWSDSSIHFNRAAEITPYFVFDPTAAPGGFNRMNGALGISIAGLDHYANPLAREYAVPSLQAHTANFRHPFFGEWYDLTDVAAVDAWARGVRDELQTWPDSIEALGRALEQGRLGGIALDNFPTVLTPEGVQGYADLIAWCEARNLPTKALIDAVPWLKLPKPHTRH